MNFPLELKALIFFFKSSILEKFRKYKLYNKKIITNTLHFESKDVGSHTYNRHDAK